MGATAFKSNGNLSREFIFNRVFQSIRRKSANNGVESCGPGEASG